MYTKVETQESQTRCLAFLSTLDRVVLDLETTGLIPYKDKIIFIIVGNKKEKFIIKPSEDTKDFEKALMLLLKDKKILGHNLKFDAKFIFYHYNVLLPNLLDTYIQARIIFNGLKRGYSLEECVKTMYKDYFFQIYSGKLETLCKDITPKTTIKKPKELNELHEVLKEKITKYPDLKLRQVIDLVIESLFDKTVRMDFTNPELVLEKKHYEYAANDINHIELLVEYHEKYIKAYNLKLLQSIEMKFIPVLVIAELFGVKLDKEKWKQNTKENENSLIEKDLEVRQAMETVLIELNEPKEEIEKLQFINLASPSQLLVFFKKVDSRIKATGNDYIFQYIRENKISPSFLKVLHLLVGDYPKDKNSYRSLAKLTSTYGNKFLNYCEGDTIRTEFNQASTTTGRLSSGDLREEYTTKNGTISRKKTNTYVPLQNLPATFSLRSCFIAEEGMKIIKIDMSAAEVRIAASQSKCKLFLQSLLEGLDLHSALAETTFRVVTGNPKLIVSKTENPKFRDAQKGITFSLFYGAGIGKIAELLNVPQSTAKKIYEGLKEKMPELFEYLEEISNHAVRYGYAVANKVTNRRRWFGEYIEYKENSDFGLPFGNIHSVRREASNFPIQGTNADMMKLSAINIEKYLRNKYGDNYNCRQLFWVHDEFVIQVPEEEVETDQQNIEQIIINTCNIFLEEVEMEVEGKYEDFWLK